ncbi:MAG: type II toxin-antitoxin system YafQ family toxin [Synergistaceae bacterium]|nr:type II toxin-antitoxin system YafQ family toxin [Synergistaceae bacterium]MBQ7069219.1 type II toxin-antitoxin system YafQ family toxin [Synergistaceae bacterium]MBR0080397.1 type II toxin-antitoxin system YafQ family toxin [Synergistaceae bacterium]MBR0233009.1 type II toxin-antitoxin system YafQ family toxin [Synergistaceae bacterium]MBR0254264.1 type II toxin-antitoxin system YafQ family toxin [Synergistaceae bacterium]
MKKLKIEPSKRFKRDVELARKRGYNIELLNDVVNMIAEGQKLPPRYRDHELKGDFSGLRECHVQSDWLLVYRIDNDEVKLLLLRTGTHSDLF